MSNPTQTFADRLLALESDGDVESFVSATFAEDVELQRPETGQRLTGQQGALTFWTEYLDRFAAIRSSFSRVHHGDLGVLEWTSDGQLSNGTDISYAGVSLLEFDESDQVTRFATYYDTRLFQPAPTA